MRLQTKKSRKVKETSLFFGEVKLSEEAAAQIAALMKRDGALFLRFSDVAGHCGGGFGYELKLVKQPELEDVLFISHGIQIAVPKASLKRLHSSKIVYRDGERNELFEDLLGEGFFVENPNVKGPCKCQCFKGYTF